MLLGLQDSPMKLQNPAKKPQDRPKRPSRPPKTTPTAQKTSLRLQELSLLPISTFPVVLDNDYFLQNISVGTSPEPIYKIQQAAKVNLSEPPSF